MCLSEVVYELLWLVNINLILVWIPNILVIYLMIVIVIETRW